MYYIIFILFLVSCSSIHMKRPEAKLQSELESQNLYGKWENNSTTLQIDCTGSFYYIEKRYGEVYNKDTGGDIVAVDPKKKELISKTIFGRNYYYYNFLEDGSMQFLVGKRAPLISELKESATWFTIIEAELTQTLRRTDKPNCKDAPYTVGEVFEDIASKIQSGEEKQVSE